jgi:Protein of unknown function (DUF4236)
MGLRFRRRIRLAPGIHLNLSGSGMSWSLGPRGASLSFGQRGTYKNLSVPRTGLYSRERVGGSQPAEPINTVRVSASISVADDGTVTYAGADGQPLNEYLVKQLKEQHKDKFLDLLARTAEEINGHLDALETIHHSTPPSDQHPRFEEQPFAELEPPAPTMKEYGFVGRFFKSTRDKVDRENALAELLYHENL